MIKTAAMSEAQSHIIKELCELETESLERIMQGDIPEDITKINILNTPEL